MRRYLSVFLIVVMIFSSGSVCAQENFQVVVQKQTAKPGECITLDVRLENNTGILGMLFDLTYDQTRLELESAQDMGLVKGAVFGQSVAQYPYTLLYNSASTTNFVADGILVRLTFKVKAEASSGMAFVALDYNPDDVFDFDLNNVNLGVVNGGVMVDASVVPTIKPSNPSIPLKPSVSSGMESNTRVEGANGSETDLAEKQIILTIGQTTATVFGEQKENDVSPKIVHDRTMLPARFVAESLGATVLWLPEEPKKVDIQKGNIQIVLYIDSDKAYINGEEVILDSVAFLENDRTYTPVRFVAEALGAKVDWDEASQKVSITVL